MLNSGEQLQVVDRPSQELLECLDLAEVQLVYNSSHFKSRATGGNVSQALVRAQGLKVEGSGEGGRREVRERVRRRGGNDSEGRGGKGSGRPTLFRSVGAVGQRKGLRSTQVSYGGVGSGSVLGSLK